MFPFLWCHFFSKKCVRETIRVLPADTNPIRTPIRACSAWRPHFDWIQPPERSITHESDKDDNWGCGGRQQQSADGGKLNWRAEMRRRQTGEQAANRHLTAIAQRKPPT